MTEVERLEGELATARVALSHVESHLDRCKKKVLIITMQLNRARRIERETRCKEV